MRLLKIDTALVKKPEMVISCATEHTINNIAQELTQENTIQYFVTVVTYKKQYIAVDNIEVLDAAVKAEQSKLHVLHMGSLHPMLTHIKLQSAKPMTNPIRIRLALEAIKDTKTQLQLNSYIDNILKVEFDGSILLSLANLVDEIFQAGIRLTIPLSFLLPLSKLDISSQKIIITKTSDLHQELKQRYFQWPDNAIFKLMLRDDETHNEDPKTHQTLRESLSKKVSSFNCSSCGTRYGLVNNDICLLEERDGCLMVQDKLGTILHPFPESEAKFLGIDENTSLRFSKYKNIQDLKKLKKIKGPFVLVRSNKE